MWITTCFHSDTTFIVMALCATTITWNELLFIPLCFVSAVHSWGCEVLVKRASSLDGKLVLLWLILFSLSLTFSQSWLTGISQSQVTWRQHCSSNKLYLSDHHHKYGLSGPNSLTQSQRISLSAGIPPVDSLQRNTATNPQPWLWDKPTKGSLYIHISIQRKQLHKLIKKHS